MTAHQIRDASLADLPAVVELVRALATFEKLEGPDAHAEQRFIADFQAGRFGLSVAERDDTVVGYALYFMTYSTFLARPSLYLEDLFVREDSRRLGIGRELLVALAGHASRSGCGRFEWSVLAWNEAAQLFYRSLGAKILEDWRICRMEEADISRLTRG